MRNTECRDWSNGVVEYRSVGVTQSRSISTPATLIWIAVLLLFVLHQDVWFWNDRTLVFGFMPVGLAYHALYSIAAGILWALAVRYAWPQRIEQWASEGESGGGKHSTEG